MSYLTNAGPTLVRPLAAGLVEQRVFCELASVASELAGERSSRPCAGALEVVARIRHSGARAAQPVALGVDVEVVEGSA